MTSKVILREVIDSDLPIFYQQQLDPLATEMAAFPARDEPAFMAHWQRIRAIERNFNRTILFDGQAAGYILGFEMAGKREVGYWLGREYWGKGIATQALGIFLGIVKQRPLYAHVAQHNRASIRVLEKCGFAIAGQDISPFDAPGETVPEWILKLEK